MKKLFWCWVCLIVMLSGLLPHRVQGQGKPQTAVLFIDPKSGEESLTLNVLFTVLDSSGQALPKDKVQFEGGGQAFGPTIAGAEATLAEATTPIRIALVIDASGSMKDEIADARQAAINFVRKTPANAEIAVYKFAEEVEEVQGFTKKNQLGLVENAILSITNVPEGTGNTCIYKAAFRAIKDVSNGITNNTAVRPAVVLFTDGRDSEVKGKSCGEIKEPQVVTQARESGVIPTQVNTIGMCGADCSNVDAAALQSLAEKTNGATFAGKRDQLDGLFDKILSILNQQWMATTNIKPKKGENTISFTFNARVNGLAADIPLNLNFKSDGDFTPLSARIEIKDRTFDKDTNVYTLKLAVANPQQVKQLIVVLLDATRNTVRTQEINPIKEELLIPVPGTELKAGSDFSIEVRAVDTNDKTLTNDEGKALASPGKHEPAAKQPPTFKFAQPPELNADRNGFVIQLNQVQRAKDVELLYNVSVTQNNRPILKDLDKDVFDGSKIEVKLPDAEVALLRKAAQPREYRFTVTLIDQVGNLTHTEEQSTTVEPPQKVSFMQRIATTLRNPIVLGSILMMFVVVAGVAVVASTRKRKTVVAQPLYTGKTVMPAEPVKLPASKPAKQPVSEAAKPQVRAPVVPVSVGSATEIEEELPPSIKINIVATPEPDSNAGREIKRFPCVIGRENSALVIAGDKKVSRQHAEITLQGRQIIVKDLDSANGTAFVVRGPANAPGTFVERKRLAKGAVAEWDNASLLRLGPNTVLELKPQGSLQADAAHTVVHDDDMNRTQIG